jgi:hypothetical protein
MLISENAEGFGSLVSLTTIPDPQSFAHLLRKNIFKLFFCIDEG